MENIQLKDIPLGNTYLDMIKEMTGYLYSKIDDTRSWVTPEYGVFVSWYGEDINGGYLLCLTKNQITFNFCNYPDPNKQLFFINGIGPNYQITDIIEVTNKYSKLLYELMKELYTMYLEDIKTTISY